MNKLLKTFFQGKNVLITGHTGFIGSWLSICLNELGANVIGYALPPRTQDDNFVVSKIENKIENIIGDIRNYDKISKIFKKYKPEIVYHLAAQPIVRKSYLNPKETYDMNVGGTINVFESYRKCDSSILLLNFTTDKCYENIELDKGYCEDARLGGYDPYSSSKACSELITQAYRRSFFNKLENTRSVSSIRSGNVVGGGDWQEDRLIPDCIRAIRNDEKIVIRNPRAIRPWQHVLEPIRGLLMLTLKMAKNPNKFSESWNFGPNKELIVDVNNVVKKIIHNYNKNEDIIQYSNTLDDLHETKVLLLDSSKSKRELGWKPLLNIDETIKLVCEWYQEINVDYDFNLKQIEYYYGKIN